MDVGLVSLLLTLNRSLKYCPGVSTVDFEQEHADWETPIKTKLAEK